MRDRYTRERYVREGLKLLVEPFLAAKGRAPFAKWPKLSHA